MSRPSHMITDGPTSTGSTPSIETSPMTGAAKMGEGTGVKGIVLAGGLGTRLGPLTQITNKHLLPVYDRPMIYFPIETLVEAGITEILVVTGGHHAGEFLRLLGNGEAFGLKHLNYTYQRGEGGIAEALSLAKDFADGQPLVVILGDNLVERSIKPHVDRYATVGQGASLLLKDVEDPERFGVAQLEGGS